MKPLESDSTNQPQERKEPNKSIILKAGNKSYEFIRNSDTKNAFQEEALRALNENFKASSIEKYDNAIIGLLLTEGLKKYSKGKEHLSEHTYDKIQKHMIHRMKAMYGPYINVFREKKGRFTFNLQQCFKTEQGRLYNSLGVMNLYVTSHAIERFEERTKVYHESLLNIRLRLMYQKSCHCSPTAWDLMEERLHRVYQFNIQGNEIFLNLLQGVLAVDILPNFVCIGKTFLSPEMGPRKGWMEDPDFYIRLIDGEITKHSVPCKPDFFDVPNGE
jgi:hypothetical protein